MRGVNDFLDGCKDAVRKVMRVLARGLNKLTRGRLHPNSVTLFGLLAHVPIAFFIANGRFGWAAVLLVVFGLFDTLDGELARLQGRTSSLGMLLDSVSDRMKEVLLYTGVGYYLTQTAAQDAKNVGYFAMLAVAACGGSLLVSYVNAWGEVVVTYHHQRHQAVNQGFRSGFLRYEVRMFLLLLGLLFHWLVPIVFLIAVLSWLTAMERLITINKQLNAKG